MRKALQMILLALMLVVTAACGPDETTPTDPGSPQEQTQEQPTDGTTDGPGDTGETTEPSGEPTDAATPTEGSSPGDGQTDDQTLNFGGFGEYRLGDTNMVERGAMVLEPECNVYISSPEFAERGIFFDLDPNSEAGEQAPLSRISVGQPENGDDPVYTDQGAQPGMTYGEIRGMYPEATEETKGGDGGPFVTLVVREEDREMVFLREDFSTDPIDDSQVVESITVRDYSEELRGSC